MFLLYYAISTIIPKGKQIKYTAKWMICNVHVHEYFENDTNRHKEVAYVG